jgi:hypothetical protein
MQLQAESTSSFSQSLHSALLEYSRSPGKYSVALRKPSVLFGAIREILQLAAGRDASGDLASQDTALREAAQFFMGTALFYPGADHYALLGLDRKVDAAEFKDRYRLLMRLIHPDFADAETYPADAAVRVNLAYEVLSSPVQRREYDGRLAAASDAPVADQEAPRRRAVPAARPAGAGMSRSTLKKLAAVCSMIGVSIVAFSLFMGRQDAVHLVQRSRTPAVEPSVVAAARQATPPGPTGITAKRVAEPVVNAPTPAAPKDVAAPRPEEAPLRTAAVKPSPPPPQTSEDVNHSLSRLWERVGVRASAVVAPAPQQRPEPDPAEAASVATPTIARTEPLPAPPPAPVTAAVYVPAPPPRPAPVPGVSLAEVQPLLSQLLQHLESGRGERLIDLLDREARSKSGAQALSQQYDGLVDGMRPVRLSHVEFKSEPADGRLLVTGHVRLQVGEQTIGSMGKKMVLRAEFAMRQGTVVMTGLSGALGND